MAFSLSIPKPVEPHSTPLSRSTTAKLTLIPSLKAVGWVLVGDSPAQLISQIIGILSIGGFTVVMSSIFWLALKYIIGIRVTLEEEMEGLDIDEHGMAAYSGFVKEAGSIGTMSGGDMGSSTDMFYGS